MKAKLLLVLVWVPLVGCSHEFVKEPACMAGYDRHISYVDSVKGRGDGLFLETYGVCHMGDFWGEYPIEIKKMNPLDHLLSGKSTPWIVDHEKAHRFEAVQRDEYPNEWITFEESWIEKFGEYDAEEFADTYANLRRSGIKTLKQQLIYDFMTRPSVY